MLTNLFVVLVITLSLANAFKSFKPRGAAMSPLRMVSGGGAISQVTGAMPTADEWLEICEPGLRKATLGMFSAVKQIAYKIRTVTCDKMTCYCQEGNDMVPIDLVANNIIFGCLLNSGVICTASSEENPTE